MSVKSNNALYKAVLSKDKKQMDLFVYEADTNVPTNPIATGKLVDGKVVTELKAHTLEGAGVSPYTTLDAWKTGMVALLKAQGYLTDGATDATDASESA